MREYSITVSGADVKYVYATPKRNIIRVQDGDILISGSGKRYRIRQSHCGNLTLKKELTESRD